MRLCFVRKVERILFEHLVTALSSWLRNSGVVLSMIQHQRSSLLYGHFALHLGVQVNQICATETNYACKLVVQSQESGKRNHTSLRKAPHKHLFGTAQFFDLFVNKALDDPNRLKQLRVRVLLGCFFRSWRLAAPVSTAQCHDVVPARHFGAAIAGYSSNRRCRQNHPD